MVVKRYESYTTTANIVVEYGIDNTILDKKV